MGRDLFCLPQPFMAHLIIDWHYWTIPYLLNIYVLCLCYSCKIYWYKSTNLIQFILTWPPIHLFFRHKQLVTHICVDIAVGHVTTLSYESSHYWAEWKKYYSKSLKKMSKHKCYNKSIKLSKHKCYNNSLKLNYKVDFLLFFNFILYWGWFFCAVWLTFFV